MKSLYNINGKIQSQAGKPWYHQPGPKIVIDYTVQDNKCRCKYECKRWYPIYQHLVYDSSLTFYDNKGKKYTSDGYKWEVCTGYKEAYIRTSPPLAPGKWHPLPQIKYTQTDKKLTPISCPSNPNPSPQHYEAIRVMYVSDYHCAYSNDRAIVGNSPCYSRHTDPVKAVTNVCGKQLTEEECSQSSCWCTKLWKATKENNNWVWKRNTDFKNIPYTVYHVQICKADKEDPVFKYYKIDNLYQSESSCAYIWKLQQKSDQTPPTQIPEGLITIYKGIYYQDYSQQTQGWKLKEVITQKGYRRGRIYSWLYHSAQFVGQDCKRYGYMYELENNFQDPYKKWAIDCEQYDDIEQPDSSPNGFLEQGSPKPCNMPDPSPQQYITYDTQLFKLYKYSIKLIQEESGCKHYETPQWSIAQKSLTQQTVLNDYIRKNKLNRWEKDGDEFIYYILSTQQNEEFPADPFNPPQRKCPYIWKAYAYCKDENAILRHPQNPWQFWSYDLTEEHTYDKWIHQGDYWVIYKKDFPNYHNQYCNTSCGEDPDIYSVPCDKKYLRKAKCYNKEWTVTTDTTQQKSQSTSWTLFSWQDCEYHRYSSLSDPPEFTPQCCQEIDPCKAYQGILLYGGPPWSKCFTSGQSITIARPPKGQFYWIGVTINDFKQQTFYGIKYTGTKWHLSIKSDNEQCSAQIDAQTQEPQTWEGLVSSYFIQPVDGGTFNVSTQKSETPVPIPPDIQVSKYCSIYFDCCAFYKKTAVCNNAQWVVTSSKTDYKLQQQLQWKKEGLTDCTLYRYTKSMDPPQDIPLCCKIVPDNKWHYFTAMPVNYVKNSGWSFAAGSYIHEQIKRDDLVGIPLLFNQEIANNFLVNAYDSGVIYPDYDTNKLISYDDTYKTYSYVYMSPTGYDTKDQLVNKQPQISIALYNYQSQDTNKIKKGCARIMQNGTSIKDVPDCTKPAPQQGEQWFCEMDALVQCQTQGNPWEIGQIGNLQYRFWASWVQEYINKWLIVGASPNLRYYQAIAKLTADGSLWDYAGVPDRAAFSTVYPQSIAVFPESWDNPWFPNKNKNSCEIPQQVSSHPYKDIIAEAQKLV